MPRDRLARDAGHFDFHDRSDGRGVAQRDCLRRRVVGVADVADVGLAILLAKQPLPHAIGIDARFVELELLAWTALHLCDELLRCERRGVAVDDDGADLRRGPRVTWKITVARLVCADERRLGIDGRIEIAGAFELFLHGVGAVVDGVQ